LALVGSGSLAHSSLIDILSDDATFDISGTANGATIKRLQGYGGALVLGAKTLTVSDAQVGDVVYTPISGTGRLALTGGTLTLGGANSYTGGTAIGTGATLIVGIGGTGGAIVGDVVDNGSLVFGTGGPYLAYEGAISGSGSVTVDSTGTVALTGINTFSGGVTIGGTLSVAQDSNLGAAGRALVLSYGTLETTGSFSTARDVEISNFGTVQVDAGNDLTISGIISGVNGALTKDGAGILTLTGVNTYSGGTGVSDGTLRATQPLPGDATIGYGGTLDAVPGMAGDLSNSGRVAVHDGDTVVSGNYTQSGYGAGILAVSLGSKLAVAGAATLNGGTLEVTGADSGYVANTHTDVLTATGGVTGTFANLVKDTGVVFTSTTIGYGANDVWLDTTGLNITVAAAAMGIVDPASASAARRVQTGFEAIDATMASGGTPSSNVLQGAGAIQHSATPAAAQATLQSLSGQLHTASAAMLFSGIDAGNHVLSEHFDDLASGRAKSGVWYSNLGWEGNLQRSGYAGASFRSGGGMAGADLRIGTRGWLGVAAGQSSGFGQLDASWDHDRTWMNTIAMYGGVVNGPWYASAQVASGWYREDMQRLLQLGALMAPVGNASTGRYMAGALEGGRLFQIGGTRVVPFADVRYQSLDLGGFAEQGGLGYGLKAEARTVGRLQTGLGLRAERGWRLANGMQMAFDGSAGWQHTLHQHGDVFNASFTGFNDWLPVEGIGLSRNTTIVRAGVSLWPTSNFGLRLGYMREQDQQERAGSAMLQGTVTF
jgi:fibronectin-binding autotransporter adhesin